MFSISILHVKHSHKIPNAFGRQLIFVIVLVKKKMDIMPKLLKKWVESYAHKDIDLTPTRLRVITCKYNGVITNNVITTFSIKPYK